MRAHVVINYNVTVVFNSQNDAVHGSNKISTGSHIQNFHVAIWHADGILICCLYTLQEYA